MAELRGKQGLLTTGCDCWWGWGDQAQPKAPTLSLSIVPEQVPRAGAVQVVDPEIDLEDNSLQRASP